MSGDRRSGRGVDAGAGLGQHEVHDLAQRFLVRIAFQPPQAVEVHLPIGTGTVADDGERVSQLGLTAEGTRVVREHVHEFFRAIADVLASAAALVAKERQHAVALGKPAVLADDLGRRLRRQRAGLVLAEQPADEGRVERHDAHGIVDTRADVADAQFDGRKLVGGTDIPPQFRCHP